MKTHRFHNAGREKTPFYIIALIVAAIFTAVKGFVLALSTDTPLLEAPAFFGAFGLLLFLYHYARHAQNEEDFYSAVPSRLRPSLQRAKRRKDNKR